MQLVDEDRPDELVGVEPGELKGKREHAHRVHAQARQQFGAPSRGAEERRVTARPHYLVWMRVEGNRNDRQAPLPAKLRRPGDDVLMPKMHAIEHADRDNGRTPVCGHVVQALPAVHGSSPLLYSAPSLAISPRRRLRAPPARARGLPWPPGS